MKKLLFLPFLLFFVFVSCDNETHDLPNDTIDEAILGVWQVYFSETIRGVRMRANGTLEIIPSLLNDTTTFFGERNEPVTSFMFGQYENIIDIRRNNQIRLYRLNDRGGVTITRDHVRYFVRGDTLFRQIGDFEQPHLYHLHNDTLTIRRIPVEHEWRYTISRYVRTSF